jgi:hypothetical protein
MPLLPSPCGRPYRIASCPPAILWTMCAGSAMSKPNGVMMPLIGDFQLIPPQDWLFQSHADEGGRRRRTASPLAMQLALAAE